MTQKNQGFTDKPGIVRFFAEISRAREGDVVEIEVERKWIRVDQVETVMRLHGFHIDELDEDDEKQVIRVKARKERFS